jgi:hypothetical protein
VLVTTIRTPTGGNETRKYAIGARNTLVFSLPDPTDPYARGLTPVDPTPQTTIVIDRAAANNVRKQYGDFYRYLKATISLRAQQTNFTYQSKPHLTIQIQLSEYKENLPTTKTNHRNTHVGGYAISNKPPLNDINYTEWHTQVTDFLTPLQSTQTPPTDQHTTFYRAFLTLAHWAMFEYRRFFREDEPDRATFVNPDAIRSLFDELLFKFHSNEVFVTRPVTVGQAPGTKYLKWINRTTDKF